MDRRTFMKGLLAVPVSIELASRGTAGAATVKGQDRPAVSTINISEGWFDSKYPLADIGLKVIDDFHEDMHRYNYFLIPSYVSEVANDDQLNQYYIGQTVGRQSFLRSVALPPTKFKLVIRNEFGLSFKANGMLGTYSYTADGDGAVMLIKCDKFEFEV